MVIVQVIQVLLQWLQGKYGQLLLMQIIIQLNFIKHGSQTGNTISLDDPNGLGWKTITITGQAFT